MGVIGYLGKERDKEARSVQALEEALFPVLAKLEVLLVEEALDANGEKKKENNTLQRVFVDRLGTAGCSRARSPAAAACRTAFPRARHRSRRDSCLEEVSRLDGRHWMAGYLRKMWNDLTLGSFLAIVAGQRRVQSNHAGKGKHQTQPKTRFGRQAGRQAGRHGNAIRNAIPPSQPLLLHSACHSGTRVDRACVRAQTT